MMLISYKKSKILKNCKKSLILGVKFLQLKLSTNFTKIAFISMGLNFAKFRPKASIFTKPRIKFLILGLK